MKQLQTNLRKGKTFMKLLKWLGIVLAGLVIVVLATAGVLYGLGWSKLNKVYPVSASALTLPTDPAAIERGRHLVETVSLCGSCHGPDLSGGILFEVAALGSFPAPNLTRGEGGVGRALTDSDWVRALRHGVDSEGRTLAFMPSNHFYYYSDSDLAAVIAYVKSAPPVDNVMPPLTLTPLGYLLTGMGGFDSELRAEQIDHTAPRPPAPPPGPSAEYGQYLVRVGICSECHGEGLVGRTAAQAERGAPAGPNLTRGGELIGWSEEDYLKALRTGVKPSGSQMSDEMPWKQIGQMSDEELHAIWLYLQSLPAQPTP
jgi:mono/diheme cytochrome c family protein